MMPESFKNKSIPKIFLAMALVSFLAAWPLWAQNTPQGSAQDREDEILFKQLKAETKKDDAQIYQSIGFGYFQQEKFDRAMFYFQRAVRLNPKLFWSWYYMGLMNLSDPETYFKNAIQANKQFAPARYWLARYYCKAQKTKDSLQTFDDYLRLAQGDPNEESRMAVARHFVEMMKSGETDFNKIVKSSPANTPRS